MEVILPNENDAYTGISRSLEGHAPSWPDKINGKKVRPWNGPFYFWHYLGIGHIR
jgi:hypothetical protein